MFGCRQCRNEKTARQDAKRDKLISELQKKNFDGTEIIEL